MAQLVNLGSLCIDNVYRVAAVTRAGETVAARGYGRFMGGKGLNQSLAAARAGVITAHVGCVGPDGDDLIATLSDAGVDVGGVRRTDRSPSGHAVIQVDDHGANAIVIVGGANRLIESADIDRAIAAVGPDGWLLLQNEINDLPLVLDAAARRGVQVAFNVAPCDGREQHYDLGSVRLLIVNEIEAAALAGETSPAAALNALTRRCPLQHVVVTCGESGLHYGCGAERIALKALSVETVDATAAGDAFIGYLLAGVIRRDTMLDALAAASVAGALAVTKPGASDSIPSSHDVASVLEARRTELFP